MPGWPQKSSSPPRSPKAVMSGGKSVNVGPYKQFVIKRLLWPGKRDDVILNTLQE